MRKMPPLSSHWMTFIDDIHKGSIGHVNGTHTEVNGHSAAREGAERVKPNLAALPEKLREITQFCKFGH
jgi:hypothetical protein